jgi:hypothetical protein
MKSGYSFSESSDVHLVPRECSKNATDAVRRYRENYPNGSVKSSYLLSGDY